LEIIFLENIRREIRKMVNLETEAWNNKDVEVLLELFHPDMVWPWPTHNQAHNPINWVIDFGRYNYDRWKKNWQGLFDTHELKHNIREIKKVVVSTEGDGAFAVVDIDTLWVNKTDGSKNHWKGRVCKVYSKVGEKWMITMHTGVLDYSDL